MKMDFENFIGIEKPSRMFTGIAGEYFVCAELSKREAVAGLAPKGTKLFDITVRS
jgi:hypothetical protein